jgi:hypothetical protein
VTSRLIEAIGSPPELQTEITLPKSWIAAIFLPSGDHAIPVGQSLVATDRSFVTCKWFLFVPASLAKEYAQPAANTATIHNEARRHKAELRKFSMQAFIDARAYDLQARSDGGKATLFRSMKGG